MRIPDAKVLAGGHSLLPAMKLRLAAPAALVDIGRIDSLKGITVSGGATIGAGTTYRELIDSAELASAFPMLGEAAKSSATQRCDRAERLADRWLMSTRRPT